MCTSLLHCYSISFTLKIQGMYCHSWPWIDRRLTKSPQLGVEAWPVATATVESTGNKTGRQGTRVHGTHVSWSMRAHILNSGTQDTRGILLLRHVDRSWNYQQAYTSEEYSSSDRRWRAFLHVSLQEARSGSSDLWLHTYCLFRSLSLFFFLFFFARRLYLLPTDRKGDSVSSTLACWSLFRFRACCWS